MMTDEAEPFWKSHELPPSSQWHPDWMRHLADSASIASVSIPGTHDTMAFQSALPDDGHVLCQALSLSDQLLVGLRFFDIRCRHVKNGLVLHHGSFYLEGNFDDVMCAFEGFLKQHPTEFVVANVQEEYNPGDNIESFAATVNKHLEKYAGYVYRDPRVPSVGEVRGKVVVLAQDYGIPGLRWPQFTIENDWTPDNEDDKYKKIIKNLEHARRASRDDLFLTFTSFHGVQVIVDEASYMNRRVNYYVQRQPYGRLGMFASDFPGPGLIHGIIRNNTDASGNLLMSCNTITSKATITTTTTGTR